MSLDEMIRNGGDSRRRGRALDEALDEEVIPNGEVALDEEMILNGEMIPEEERWFQTETWFSDADAELCLRFQRTLYSLLKG